LVVEDIEVGIGGAGIDGVGNKAAGAGSCVADGTLGS